MATGEKPQSYGNWPPVKIIAVKVIKKHFDQVQELLKALPKMKRTLSNGETRLLTDEERLESCLQVLASIAANPDKSFTRSIQPPYYFFDVYAPAPDFVLDLLTQMRSWWTKNSPSRRVQVYMMREWYVKPFQSSPSGMQIWDCEDGELAQAFESKTGESVTVENAKKARQALIKQVKDGINLPLLG